MNNYFISVISHNIVFFADSIFVGLKVTVPVLFLISLLIKNRLQPNLQICIKTVNRLLILGGVLFILTMILNIILAWSAGNEAERDMMIAFATGPHWYQFFLPVLNYAILPLILWFRTLRTSLYPVVLIVLVWFTTYLLTDYLINREQKNMGFKNEFDYQQYLIKTGVFLIFCTVFYGFEKWKRYKNQVDTI